MAAFMIRSCFSFSRLRNFENNVAALLVSSY
jgi:hypothetical protein